jgi:hypothetical protein
VAQAQLDLKKHKKMLKDSLTNTNDKSLSITLSECAKTKKLFSESYHIIDLQLLHQFDQVFLAKQNL